MKTHIAVDFCREREHYWYNMADPEIGDPFIQQATAARLIIGKGEYRYKFTDRVAGLLRQGFASSGLEYDILSADALIERGRTHGIQPGTGILSDPDRIRPDVKARMDKRYGAGQWEYVDIVDGKGASCFKPLVKPSDPHK